jgi:hypothetical protein
VAGGGAGGKIGNVVRIFVVKHTCIYTGPPSASSKTCYKSNCNILVRKITKKVVDWGGGGGKRGKLNFLPIEFVGKY